MKTEKHSHDESYYYLGSKPWLHASPLSSFANQILEKRYMHLIVHVWTHMLAGLISKEETPRPIHPIIESNDAYARVHKHHICREAGPPWSRLPTDRIQEELAGMDSIFTLNQDRCKWNGTNANVINRGKHSADRQKRLLNACGVSREQRQCRARRRHTHRTVHLYLLVVTRFPASWNLHTARPQFPQPVVFLMVSFICLESLPALYWRVIKDTADNRFMPRPGTRTAPNQTVRRDTFSVRTRNDGLIKRRESKEHIRSSSTVPNWNRTIHQPDLSSSWYVYF